MSLLLDKSRLVASHRQALVYALLLLAVGSVVSACAEVTLPPIFSDGMILQAGVPVPIWGKASPGETVSVEFAGQKKTCQTDSTGRWSVKLDALAVSAQPRVLKAGARVLTDVLVGEVWLCAGQSNMEMPIGDMGEGPHSGGGSYRGVANWRQEIAAHPGLRLFRDDNQPNWSARGWRHCEGEDLRVFSATAYFFGRALQQKLDVPVGLIDVSRGGSSIQNWTPRDYALRNPVTRRYSALFHQRLPELHAFNKANEKAYRDFQSGHTNVLFPAPLPNELTIANRFGGSYLFDSFIQPLAPYAVKGVVWYQGESNGSFPETARVYDSMLRDLIEGWRARWGQAEMPWCLVQLPCWAVAGATNWPWVRQGQLTVAQTVPQVGVVTTCDFGDATNLHPPQKRELGERLATLVLARSYSRKLVGSGPTVQLVRRVGPKLLVQFDPGGAPMRLKKGAWDNIEIAGQDGVFYPATASLTGAVATVSTEAVSLPGTLRYGWTNAFRPSLFNEAGFPASPFALAVEPGDTFHLLANEASPLTPLAGERWCAIGDSITHGGGYLKTIYLYCATRFPENRFDLFNCGSGGDTADGTLNRRMESDILVHKPTRSTVMLGINDIWWEHSGLIASNDYIRDLARIVDRLQQANSGVILITPSPYDATARSPEPLDPKRAGLERYVHQLRALASERAIPVVDFFQVMSDLTAREQAKDPAFTLLAPDRVHPNATGNFLMACTFLETLRAPKFVSRVRLDAANPKSLRTENCALAELSCGQNAIAFSLLENSIPIPPSEIPEASLPLVPFTRNFNQEILQVIGLKAGQYELTIDSVPVGIFPSARLSEGVNLALIAETPQNRQAARVADLNNKRTEIISQKLRWLAMMEYGALKKHYDLDDVVTPRRDWELLQRGAEGEMAKYWDLKPQQSKFLRAAQDYDDQIWQSNKPLRHHWRLVLK